ncbi:MAG: hypothetical protein P4M05_16135 [Bradyrhizobium sp.]|nr:hypothetical protein [Bradyrhizobium sp.]
MQQDLAILDDQDNHLVLTLRVPKEFIRENRWMLSALSEACMDRSSIGSQIVPAGHAGGLILFCDAPIFSALPKAYLYQTVDESI